MVLSGRTVEWCCPLISLDNVKEHRRLISLDSLMDAVSLDMVGSNSWKVLDSVGYGYKTRSCPSSACRSFFHVFSRHSGFILLSYTVE